MYYSSHADPFMLMLRCTQYILKGGKPDSDYSEQRALLFKTSAIIHDGLAGNFYGHIKICRSNTA
ncbi:Hypothetical protein GbCGDNIH9_1272 [Granulibacter bethesdensis]|uniref:Uncharacterized protein n=1 Tax=Granulibacter bethesdensis TaxID=364410 RepID=A0AAC9P8I2_9PROT|nr:Hypothetical protein GbCGDNIH9_1272 [Granulibacter bethesdensis]APH62158.1 Hypothetical protein GbCGDNIH8_1272 [Granulibacter bethesdensis]